MNRFFPISRFSPKTLNAIHDNLHTRWLEYLFIFLKQLLISKTGSGTHPDHESRIREYRSEIDVRIMSGQLVLSVIIIARVCSNYVCMAVS